MDQQTPPNSSFGLRSWQRLRRWLRGELVALPIERQIPALTDWFQGDCGQLVLEQERAELDTILPSLFGYHLLQMSVSEGVELASSSPIHHRISLGCTPPRQQAVAPGCTVQCCAHVDSLPFETDAVDVVLLHHLLEFSHNPHQVLKEAHRVLMPRGHLVIISFNRYSLLGLWKWVASLISTRPHWQYNAITRRRLHDWFKFLDLEETSMTTTFYRPPCQNGALLGKLGVVERLGRLLRLPFGGVTIIVARKDVHAVTPIRAPWEKHPRRLLGVVPVRSSTTRTPTCRHPVTRHNRNSLH